MNQKPVKVEQKPGFLARVRRFLPPAPTGIAIGVTFGVIARLVFESFKPIFDGAMTMSFMVGLPTVLGALTVILGNEKQLADWKFKFFLPWLTIASFLVVTLIAHLEGFICVAMALPLWIPLAGFGGLLTGWLAKKYRDRKKETLTFLLALPFVLAPLEKQLPPPLIHYDVTKEAIYQADPAEIWAQITRPGSFSPTEFSPTFFHWIGIPNPQEASQPFDSLGSERLGIFEKGLIFEEKVTEWVPNERFSFSVHIDPKDVPPTTLDEHVLVGGRYYDLETVSFHLIPLENGQTQVVFSSRHRLSSNLNLYLKFWVNAVVGSYQDNFLQVLETRLAHENEGLNAQNL
ncbi:MAG: hypothetical protein H6581_08220 [Bacteroidia bacterium]|nr:hypothetical protein [Bacteroidia bacterium]